MQRLLVALIALAGIAGCRSNPYCLNCKDSGNGVVAPARDMAKPADLTPNPLTLLDMTGMNNGMCVPSNGGVEVCDGLDNDCNGTIDDVSAAKLQSDGNNCGACGKICSYLHATGVCTNAMCSMGVCQPGFIDLDNDPSNGCEYTCTPTANPTEICDGKDNNCDGQVDEGFTATWSDAQHQHPLYDNNTLDCGQCGVVCSLGVGTVMACNGTGTGGRGVCAVAGCFNGTDTNGNRVTYRSNGNKDTLGCQYLCPFPSTQTGIDCDNGGCTFPAETCNGKDDDCNFAVDDGAAQPAANTRCPDNTPGKLCSDATPAGQPGACVGECKAGFLMCNNGAIVCDPATTAGPHPEMCDKKDNDCNGKVDELWTATWNVDGSAKYDSDPNNCGMCGTGCSYSGNGTVAGCHLTSGAATKGTCYVQACKPGWAWVANTDQPGTTTCTVPAAGTKDQIGCYYQCPTPTQSGELCDGLDNDCNGCVDDGVTNSNYFCATKGVCGAPGVQPIAIKCQGTKGWKCDYSTVTGVSTDGNGDLTLNEKQCDGVDNNCDGKCDENFPDVLVVANPAGPPAGTTCGNAHPVKSCTTGLGKCQNSANYVCSKSAAMPAYNDQESCTVSPKATPTAELCNGIDDNCNGQIDEATDLSAALHGVHDPVAVVSVPAAPAGCTDKRPDGSSLCGLHTVWMYQYEASRPDASGISGGSLPSRACSNAGVMPWANVTEAQALAACQAIKDPATGKNSIGRLCTAWEWTTACIGVPAFAGSSHWSINASGALPAVAHDNTTYTAAVCNDANEPNERCSVNAQCPSNNCDANGKCVCAVDVDCNAGFHCDNATVNPGGFTNRCIGNGVWPTGSKGDNAADLCFTPFVDANNANAGVHDMTGNVGEWTQTQVATASGTGATISGAANGVQTITGLTSGIYGTDNGAILIVSGAANANNNGAFIINTVTFVGGTNTSTVTIANPAGTASDTNSVSWSLIYYKNRGGSFSSNQGGGVCEFDFVLAKAAFFNNDLGFRCCFDQAP